MAVRADSDLVSHELLTRGHWEIQQPATLLEQAGASGSALPTSGTFLDIGANLGFYTLLFAHYGYDVLAVEPMLLNRLAIETSLCLNPALARRVSLVPLALSTAGHVARVRCVVRADDRNAGNGKLTCSAAERCAVRPKTAAPDSAAHATICESVRLSTLDELLRQHAARLSALPLVAVKLDVEGFECNVLEGGPALFETHRPHVLVAEANRKHIQQCLKSHARQYGYRIAATRPGNSAGEGDINWILLRGASGGGGSGGGGGGGRGGSGREAVGRPPPCTKESGCCKRHPHACTDRG